MTKPVVPLWVDLLASISAVASFVGVAAVGAHGLPSQLVFNGSVVCFAITVIAGISAQYRILAAVRLTPSPIGFKCAALLSLRLGAAPWLWGALGIVVAAAWFASGDPVFYRLAGVMVFVGVGLIALGVGQWLIGRKT